MPLDGHRAVAQVSTRTFRKVETAMPLPVLDARMPVEPCLTAPGHGKAGARIAADRPGVAERAERTAVDTAEAPAPAHEALRRVAASPATPS